MSELRNLYPELEPFDTGRLKVSPLHELYYEECGNPEGKPVIFLHGGPGAGLVPDYRRFFDPAAYRIILFDQLGRERALLTPLLKTTLPGISSRISSSYASSLR
jgi:proline iminopeptidase